MPPSAAINRNSTSRRALLVLGLVALSYPLLRFIGFKVPRKPRKIEINTAAPASGVVTHTDFILFDREGASWAVSRKCTHLGCRVNYHEQDNILECPCHQSRFSPDGKVVHGPAKRDLVIYEVEKREAPPFYTVIT